MTAAESPEGRSTPVRRSGRQAKRTDKLEEFLVTVKRGRGAGRRSAPTQLEGSDPPSQTLTDVETASEASFDGNAEVKMAESKAASPVRKTRGRARRRVRARPKGGAVGSVSEDGCSSENEEEAGGDTVKQSREEAMMVDTEDCKAEEPGREPKQEQDVVQHEDEEEKSEKDGKEMVAEEPANKRHSRSPAKAAGKDAALGKRDAKPKALQKSRKEEEDDDDDSSSSSSSSESDNDGYDPNALYCICRQKHNKRFMICCDRCEEWFHGDCVGITEARGRLMERNSEDYVCPNCTGRKAQTTKPSASAGSENGKRPTPPATPAATSATAPAAEDKAGEELGIKGRIEKATNPSGKKKIKIFQPVAAEGSSLPKCIGPGCERDALPDSVYCGNDCILRHAAAAMKTITTDSKETKPKEKAKPKVQKKTASKSALKSSSESENREDEEDEDDEDKLAEEHPPPPAMSSWSSDHNYIAVTPEKTTPISPSVLNKACMYLLEGFPPFNDLSLPVLMCMVFLNR
uniref:PHD-type domain-containing protein n=1 Tax=Electrophorus electricus TaxID=8005 RepID=A0A4W4FHI6_ELEEL